MNIVKLLRSAALALLLVVMTPLELFAATYSASCGTDVRWTLNTETGLLSFQGTGAMNDFVDSGPWVSLQENIKRVEIGAGITKIGDHAFRNCSKLASVIIPNTVTSIGYCSFEFCTSLTSITIPNSVLTIGNTAFHGCGLQSVVIPNSVTTIGKSAFFACHSLTSIELGTSLRSIGDNAFEHCDILTSVTCKAVTPPSMGDNVFQYVPEETLYVPIESIDAYKKSWGWNHYSAHTLPILQDENGGQDENGEQDENGGQDEKDEGQKDGGTCGTDVTWNMDIDTGLLTIDGSGEMNDYTNENFVPWKDYRNCIKRVKIADGITKIGNYAFDSCNELISITIPEGVTAIGEAAFKGCSKLSYVDIPRTVNSIGRYAFAYSGIVTITFPSTVINIAEYVCAYCVKLQFVTIFSAVSIGSSSFRECTALKKVYLPNTLISIGIEAFKNCSSLVSVICDATTPPSMSYDVDEHNPFYGVPYNSTMVFYVPQASVNYYRSYIRGLWIYVDDTNIQPVESTVQGTCGNNLTWELGLSSGVLKIDGSGAMTDFNDIPWYNYRESIINVQIGRGVTSICNDAFSDCVNLVSVSIPESVTSIGNCAFEACTSLVTVIIPSHVKYIRRGTFERCSSLVSVTLPEGLTGIGDVAFCGCTSLSHINMPQSVTNFGEYPFTDCNSLPVFDNIRYADTYLADVVNRNLESYTIKPGTRIIGYQAFRDCWNLRTITIPESVEIIANYAFSACKSLSSITIPGNVKSIDYASFEITYFAAGNFINKSECTNEMNWGANIVQQELDNGLLVNDNQLIHCRPWAISVTIPSNITYIPDQAFRDCYSLKSVTIPSSMEYMDNYAFYFCYLTRDNFVNNSSLVDANMWRATMCDMEQNDGTLIKDNVVVWVRPSATAIVIPEGIEQISGRVARHCISLTSVSIPSTVTSIGYGAFNAMVEDVTIFATTPPVLTEGNEFADFKATLHVLPGCKAAYEAADYWKKFTIVEDAVGPDGSDGDNPTDLATALYAIDSEGCANGSFALPIELKSEFTVKAFQFDVVLPEGMSFISDNGAYECNRTNRINAGFSVICNSKTGESSKIAQILCSNTSNPNATISGTSGVVLYIPVNIADGVEDGDYEVAVKNITLVKADGEEYKDLKDKVFKAKVSVASYILGDANNSGEVNVADITAVVSHIYGQTPNKFNLVAADVNASGEINVADITGIVSIIYGGSANARSAAQLHNEEVTLSMPSVVTEQGTEVNVPIYINNVDAVSAYQFDLTLPKGVEVKDVHSTSNAHQCLGAYMEDGTYRIMSYSMMNEKFINPAVPVGYVTLTVSHDATVGTYDMPLSAATSTANGKENSTHVANGRLIVGNATGISSIDDKGAHSDTITTLGGVKMNPTANLPKGIYIINGKKQIIK